MIESLLAGIATGLYGFGLVLGFLSVIVVLLLIGLIVGGLVLIEDHMFLGRRALKEQMEAFKEQMEFFRKDINDTNSEIIELKDRLKDT